MLDSVDPPFSTFDRVVDGYLLALVLAQLAFFNQPFPGDTTESLHVTYG